MTKLALALLVLLAGCRGSYGDMDNRIMCSLDGRAYFVQPGAGQMAFLKPLPESNSLCAPLK